VLSSARDVIGGRGREKAPSLLFADLEVRMSEPILEGMCCVLNENVLV
jgi:hypothetical protein